MKVLIVDDEPKIRNGLKNLVTKLNKNWKVIGTAIDGITTIDLIKKDKPDVLLLDIKMPNMDGFELLESISAQRKDIIIIIISGHAEFEYAQKAVRYGVFDYILKPVNPRKVNEVLENVDKILAERNRLIDRNVYVEDSIRELREKFLQDIIFETVYISEEEALEKCEFLKIKLHKFAVVTLIMGLDSVESNIDTSTENSNLVSLFYEALEKYEGGFIFCNGIGSFILIVRLDYCNQPDLEMKRINEDLMACTGNKTDVLIGLGGIYDSIFKVTLSYKESILMIKNQSTFRSPNVAQNWNHSDASSGIINNLKSNTMNYPALIRHVINYISKNYNKKLRVDDMAKYVYVNSNYLSELFKKETGENLSDFITDYRIEMAKKLLLELENKVYIVAEKTGFNDQRYFSQVFKKKTGMTPAEYRERKLIES